ncbi:2-amino-4-hydroxy-6-hydroxymethyldihydropteridine diphosphokinase [Mucilaginibacter ginsenosidivorans]|uniref:2-amino-4-hydroxy-6-hydroxymethyldihydropteridine pyrophosphokinase n=1 Tax=Mucilaginibacter ginsenosidivorans TaxID=398053 RepID=A0A5B8V055_9SPHI|nr:2-amino-4-hydroxy-6-hydroxymethyldihydropteridine diphosphokinase [Mucilaginibacter ginsenosidivorans]QEC64840.1 2-amino-4-hydroxy-6-hydroxymethyldihydropteridine diphosphokinase [Mucilaginibacter ginsenosidivorans]
MIDVFLLLGSNLGDRQSFLSDARNHIKTGIAPIVSASSVYETQSWGKTDEPDYLNQVLYLKTGMPPQQLLETILGIEKLMGRKREEKWGSRIIDIDILFYGHEIINETDLKVPHPELHKRMFTLEPLNEIAPDFIHPVLNKSIFELKSELKSDLHVKKL